MTELNANPQPIRILFTHYGDNWIRGSERCLLDLLHHLDKAQFTPVLWCNQQIMVDAAQKLGIEVYHSDFPLLFGWQAPRFDFPAFIGLVKQAVKLIDKHQIKLIHANSAAPCQWLNFAARQCHIPLICHLHSIYQQKTGHPNLLALSEKVMSVRFFARNQAKSFCVTISCYTFSALSYPNRTRS